MRFFLLFIVICIAQELVAQEINFIWEPEYSYTWKQSDRYIWNAKFKTRNSLNDIEASSFLQFIQPSLSLIYNSSPRVKLGVGYNYRYRNPFLSEQLYEHRLTQQLGFISFIGDRRFSHRIRFEQRFRTESFQHRYRYRISYDFPLTGSKLDSGEQYMIFKNEIVNAITDSEVDFENRITAGIGWYYSPQRKFEMGAEYRTQDIGSGSGIRHLFLVYTSFYINR